jgi:hypothetical protein
MQRMTRRKRNFPPCPSCRSADPPLRILYGYPDIAATEAAHRGEATLGGCMIGDESPDFECRSCGAPLPWVARRRSSAHAPGS